MPLNPASTPLRILLTADPELPVPPIGYGGIERIVDSLAGYFRAAGHRVALLAHPDSTCSVDARFAWPALTSLGPGATLRNTVSLARAVRAFSPDVVHSFSRLAYLLPILPHLPVKLMSYQRHTGGRQITWAARLGSRRLRFTGCSEFICAMGRRFGGTWHAIHNFVEAERFPFTPTVPSDAPLLFLSRVEAIKGPHLAIAIARRSRRKLIIAGNRASSAAERAYWDREIAPHVDGKHVEFVGEVDDVRKRALLARAAALVVPVQWDEPFGIVFAEALAAGVPIVTCRRGALPEIVTEGVTGFFLRTAEDGAVAIARLPQIDRAVCRKAAEQRFSLPVCAQQYLDVYRALLADASKAKNGAP